MMTFLQAIARQEGFYAAGTRPARNLNPGDIEYGRFAIAHGATGTDGRFAIFPTEDAGFAAMKALFRSGYSGLTVKEAINKWAPPVENDDTRYINNLCGWAGCHPDDLIDPLLEVA